MSTFNGHPPVHPVGATAPQSVTSGASQELDGPKERNPQPHFSFGDPRGGPNRAISRSRVPEKKSPHDRARILRLGLDVMAHHPTTMDRPHQHYDSVDYYSSTPIRFTQHPSVLTKQVDRD